MIKIFEVGNDTRRERERGAPKDSVLKILIKMPNFARDTTLF